ncbi:MAG: ABC transporter ATP-binding protein [Candidatus Cloacimonadota bacterium]|nr:MAG: ABC transporter ATP-binding protein [Candidatus Cloacimonadota bacterium]PIE78100.1 MAG: ABC transporter ATP-binding protein [Candidatus Delongbacteria bacterium]
MALVELKNISYTLSGTKILDETNLIINSGERIFLLGRNGVGKTTLLKMISGDLKPDSGDIIKQKNLIIGYMPQDIVSFDGSLFEYIVLGAGKVGKLLVDFHKNIKLERFDENNSIQNEIEKLKGWDIEQRCEKLLSMIGLKGDILFSSLSSGLKRKVTLAKAIISFPNILILDEPTNHMDIPTVKWLEKFLLDLKITLVIVTHDRRFLRTMATSIIELRKGKVFKFGSDYDEFLIRRDHIESLERENLHKLESFIKSEEYWAGRSITARRTRNEGRSRRIEALKKERDQRKEYVGKMNVVVDSEKSSGRLVAKIKDISFKYDKKYIVKSFSSTILRKDRVGIIGPNGCGKSTLIKLLLGKLTPESGEVELGTKLNIGYFDQNVGGLDPNLTVKDNVLKGTDFICLGGREIHINSYLKRFLFPQDRHNSPISSLSGGEKNRLQLAKLFSKPVNFMVLDEPTNDLDMETLELLEELLLEFDGTSIIISHDREFLDNIVTSSIYFTPNGIEERFGGYEDIEFTTPSVPKNQKTEKIKREKKVKKRKLSFNERRELEKLPDTIDNLEKEIDRLNEDLTTPEVYLNVEKLTKTKEEIALKTIELEESIERWGFLEEILSGE